MNVLVTYFIPNTILSYIFYISHVLLPRSLPSPKNIPTFIKSKYVLAGARHTQRAPWDSVLKNSEILDFHFFAAWNYGADGISFTHIMTRSKV